MLSLPPPQRGLRPELVDLDAGPLLPPEALWVYGGAPFLFAPILHRDLFEMSVAEALRAVAGDCIPFVGLSIVFYLLYQHLVPALLRRVRPRPSRIALHLGLTAVVAVVVGLGLRAVAHWFTGHRAPLLRFEIICIIMSWILIFPALAIQHHRRHARNTERAAQGERQAVLEAELRELQARTNPHFFFNSLNTVAALIPSDPALAERLLERFAEIFRYALVGTRTRTVALSREFEMVRHFLAIQEARFGTRLRTHVELGDGVADVMVPPLVLQPIVENAILHGLSARAGGVVSIVARRSGNRVLIDVTDDGPGPGASSHQGTQTSLEDLRRRLELLYGAAGGLELRTREEGGALVRIILPAALAPA